MNIQMEMKSQRAVKNLRRIAKHINQSTQDVVENVTELGWRHARALAPFHTGELVSKIIFDFPQEKEGWIISLGEHSSGMPLNVIFDRNEFGNMTMWGQGRERVPFEPKKPSSIGFMKQTADFVRNEFSKRLNLEIEKI